MAIHVFRCEFCGAQRESLRKAPKCNHGQEEEGEPHPVTIMMKLLSAPNLKFMEPRMKEKGASVLKDQEKILKERAKEHSRLNDWHDLTQENNLEMAKRQGWLNENGTIKKKLDTK